MFCAVLRPGLSDVCHTPQKWKAGSSRHKRSTYPSPRCRRQASSRVSEQRMVFKTIFVHSCGAYAPSSCQPTAIAMLSTEPTLQRQLPSDNTPISRPLYITIRHVSQPPKQRLRVLQNKVNVQQPSPATPKPYSERPRQSSTYVSHKLSDAGPHRTDSCLQAKA